MKAERVTYDEEDSEWNDLKVEEVDSSAETDRLSMEQKGKMV